MHETVQTFIFLYIPLFTCAKLKINIYLSK